MAHTNKLNLKGSPNRDEFKQWHKTGPKQFYACDLDFVLVEKHPSGIAAFLDYKMPGDVISFAEVIVYTELSFLAPVYIVESMPPFDTVPISVYEFVEGDFKPEPPTVKLRSVLTDVSQEEFFSWEGSLRKEFNKKPQDIIRKVLQTLLRHQQIILVRDLWDEISTEE